MNLRVLVLILLFSTIGMARAQAAEVVPPGTDLDARVQRIIAELADVNPTVREKADLKMRNLPLPAYPIITALYAKEKDALDPEVRSRIENCIEMFKALAVLDERSTEYWKWIRENALKAYDEDSDRSPKWDTAAREAITLAMSWPRSAAQTDRMLTLFKQASDAGCQDPLFIYYHALSYSRQPDADEHKTVQMLREAATSITHRYPYPAWIRCMVAARAQAATMDRPDLEPPDDDSPPAAATTYPSFIFEKMIKPEDDVPAPLLYDMADMMSKLSGNSGSKHWYEQLSKPFEELAPDSVYLHVLKGTCYGRAALAAEGDVREDKLVEEQEKRFKTAQEELEKAYQMDPRVTIVSTEMLRVLFRSGAEREEIDKWFKRALEVNPDNFAACKMMLEDLPAEDKLEFGRQCFALRNWRGRLAFILVEAHERLANLSDDKVQYWQRAEVWKDLKQVYDIQLELFPQAVFDRSYYALLANQCHQWSEADRQFKILGDKPSLKVFASMASYNYQRKKAAKNVVQ